MLEVSGKYNVCVGWFTNDVRSPQDSEDRWAASLTGTTGMINDNESPSRPAQARSVCRFSLDELAC